MKVLLIGGTGLISTAVSSLAIQKGFDVYLLNRGMHSDNVPEGAKFICGDIRDEEAAGEALKGYKFDVVAEFIGFTPEHVETDIRLFSGRVRQYIYISSASVYEKPVKSYVITEETPIKNPFWEYSRLKIASEERLMLEHRETGFPVTIVRPSHTYSSMSLGTVLNSWNKTYTIIDRIKRGQKIVVPGDGTSLWVMTHNTDFAKGFVGLFGNEKAIGETFQITSDEVLNWNTIYEIIGEEVGVKPNIVHIPSDYIAACLKERKGVLLGDQSESVFFDNSKIKWFVPEFHATTTFREGVRQYLKNTEADSALREIDEDWNQSLDKLIALYERAYEGL